MYNDVYCYHDSDTRPTAEDLTGLIFGVELEISDSNETVREILDFGIDEDYLTAPSNEGYTRNWKTIEEDGSVYREIILNADTKENILKRVKNLNMIGLNSNNMLNREGTSCHIHINRAYLDKVGITQTNIFKLFELYSPIIYAISGRDKSSFLHWSEPRSTFETNNINWHNRAEEVSHISPSSDRYTLVNCRNTKTIELRGFSNVWNFNHNMIEFYLSFVTFCIEQAETMKGKYYINEYERLLNEMEEFLNTVYPHYYSKFNLRRIFKNDKHLQKLKNHYLYVSTTYLVPCRHFKLGAISDGTFVRDLYYWVHRKELKKYNHVTLTHKGLVNSAGKIETEKYKSLYSYFMEYYRTLSHEEQTGDF